MVQDWLYSEKRKHTKKRKRQSINTSSNEISDRKKFLNLKRLLGIKKVKEKGTISEKEFKKKKTLKW